MIRTISGVDNTPVLNANTLSSLAWIKGVQEQHDSWSLNGICALLGTLKDFGAKQTPSFFDQIYANQNVPNPPQWRDANGQYNLTWHVSTPGTSASVDQDQQIQAALAAATHLSQDELRRVADLLLDSLAKPDAPAKRTIPLTADHLAVFYRFAQLPALTGLSLDECFVALSLPGAPEAATLLSGKQSAPTLTWLIEFAKWIQASALSTYEVQYILTGQSQSQALQNQILGSDSIQNFVTGLTKSLQSTLLTDADLENILGDLVQPFAGDQEKSYTGVYHSLQPTYIETDGTVKSVPSPAELLPILTQAFSFHAQAGIGNVYIKSISDSITAYLNQEQKKILSENDFTNHLTASLTAYLSTDQPLSRLWNALEKDRYIAFIGGDNAQAIVQKQLSGTTEALTTTIQNALPPTTSLDALTSMTKLTGSALTHAYESQQSALNQQLAGLYGVADNQVPALILWEGYRQGEIPALTPVALKSRNNPLASIPLLKALLSSPLDTSVAERLHILQQYAYLVKNLFISATELQSLCAHPQSYGIKSDSTHHETIQNPFTLESIKTIDQFKKLVLNFQDSQNCLVKYIEAVAQRRVTKQEACAELSQISQWQAESLQFLLDSLWTEDQQEQIAPWGTIDGLVRLQAWFQYNRQCHLDMAILWEAYQLSYMSTTDQTYSRYANLADMIWGGLNKTYADQTEKLNQISGPIEEQTRAALLPLVFRFLQSHNISLQSTSDLYNYLLIDVDVSGAIETSFIREGISALQLYISRCLNHLEPGINVDQELIDQWDWFAQYQVWEDSRQVFLYPENYLEPELRKGKTPLFSKLENELKQIDLRNLTRVDEAFQSYMDGFIEVANLKIVGIAGRDICSRTGNAGTEEYKKEICMIGRTDNQPYKYFYRTAIFHKDELHNVADEGQYAPVAWEPWQALDISIQAIGPVTPAFALGKWYIFWVEQTQTGAKDSTGSGTANTQTTQPEYSAKIQFSYINLSKKWVSAQTFKEPIPLTSGAIDEKTPHKEYWDRVYPVGFSASENIVIPYGATEQNGAVKFQYLYNWNEGLLQKGVTSFIKYASPDQRYSKTPFDQFIPLDNSDLKTRAAMNYSYWLTLETPPALTQPSSDTTSEFTVSAWVNRNSSADEHFPLFDCGGDSYYKPYFSVLPKEDVDYIEMKHYQTTYTSLPTKSENFFAKEWQHITLCNSTRKEIQIDNDKSEWGKGETYYSQIFSYNNRYYLIRIVNESISKDKVQIQKNLRAYPGGIFLAEYFPFNGKAGKVKKLYDSKTENGAISTVASLTEKAGQIYFCWGVRTSDGKEIYKLAEIIPDQQQSLQNEVTIQTAIEGYPPSICAVSEQLYGAWYDGQDLIVGKLQETGEVDEITKIMNGSSPIPAIGPCIAGYPKRSDHNTFTDTFCITWTQHIAATKKWPANEYNYGVVCQPLGKASIAVEPIFLYSSIKNTLSRGQSLICRNQRFYTACISSASKGSQAWIRLILFDGKNSINESFDAHNIDSNNAFVDISNISNLCYLLTGYTNLQLIQNDTVMIYLNGDYFDSFYLGKTLSLNKEVYLGYSQNPKASWNGRIQEGIVYNRALTEKEVSLLYENSKDQITRDFKIKDFEKPPTNKNGEKSTSNYHQLLDASYGDTGVAESPIYAVGQPNMMALSSSGIELLNLVYNGADHYANDAYRLNTTAASQLAQTLFTEEIPGLLTIASQEKPEIPFAYLLPDPLLVPSSQTAWPSSTIDFNLSSAMAEYYWEVFFHIPFLMANVLQTAQQFKAAKTWYEYIFNPTISKPNWELSARDDDPHDKYWRFLGLRSFNNSILNRELRQTWAEGIINDTVNTQQLYQYHHDPFDPHAIAALRPIAYQKCLMMRYVNNLISWGDYLFRQYTVESIVEATMFYVMAYNLLGEQPVNMGPCPLPAIQTLNDLSEQFGSTRQIPEFLIHLENHMSALTGPATNTPSNYIPGIYFGLPDNAKFVAYWDTVKQRLYNIRHGLNIEGVQQQLALFHSPLSPVVSNGQVGSGESLSQTLATLQVRIPYYRFDVMIQKAKMANQIVVQFGQSLLAALEKKDAEQINVLNHTHQLNLLEMSKTTKEDQLEATKETVASLQASLQSATNRYQHYQGLIDQGWSAGETAQVVLNSTAIGLQILAQVPKGIAAPMFLLPNSVWGGMEWGNAILQGASIAEGTGAALNMGAGLAGTIASFERRSEDWELQRTLAADDQQQIQHQIIAAQYQQSLAQHDMELLNENIVQEKKIETFLKTKFTNVQLYQWMTGKLSALYFQAYQLAYNLALQTEQAWQFEKGRQKTFIQGHYWESLHQGLLAGEALQLDLERMETAYMDQDKRRFEIHKTLSLASLDSGKVLDDLKTHGTCVFDLTEKDFDLDYPGHYCRQIKSLSLSFPILVGPYQNIHATLTQTSNKTVLQPDIKTVGYLLNVGVDGTARPDPSQLRIDAQANQQIALSQGVNDSGLFMLNFNDARYLPFEGTGAVSSWELSIPQSNNPDLELSNLTDVILQIQYTALPGNQSFAIQVHQACERATQ